MSSLTFRGFRRPDGRVGVRNHVLVVPTVICANGVIESLDRADDVGPLALVTHQHGCGQIGDDLALTQRTLGGIVTNPNVAAVALVSLGCETNQPDALADRARGAGKVVETFSIQELGGITATYEAVRRWVVATQTTVHAEREEIPAAELVVGLECGGSDAWSGITANPALGLAADALVEAGATVVLAETPEAIGAEHLLAARARTPEVAARLRERVRAWEEQAGRRGVDIRGAQPAVGNIAGGLSTIEEKSVGALQKGGSTPLNEVIDYAARPGQSGLVFMDTPGQDIEQVTGLAAGGAQLVCFTTGRGTPTGSPVLPVLKISSNTRIAELFAEHIDVDAGRIVSGEATLEDVGRELVQAILDVASGAPTAAERGRHREFAIPRLWSSL
ncbi:MAG TPA: UxaA family hydrolase [Solirubrobacteraceae bacterium]